MYSRRTGILQTSNEGLKKIENFNQNLREQYNSRNNSPLNIQKPSSETNNKNQINRSLNLSNILSAEEIVIIGLILILILENEKDLILLGVLGLLLFIN